jgi:hypothetical protein
MGGLFTSNLFLKAFALVRGSDPIYDSQMWIVKRAFVKLAECSPWNGFIADPETEFIVQAAKEHGAWVVTFTSQAIINDPRFESLPPSPTLLTFPDYAPSKKVRWSLRKASRLKASIEPNASSEMHPLLDHLWERLGRGIPDEFYSILEGAGVGHTLLARVGGKPVACLFYLVDDDKVHYLYSLATSPAYMGSEITSLLVSSFVQKSFAEGAPYLDLCGASVPSIYMFKKQFASTIAWRPRYIATMNPLWNLAKLGAPYLYRDLSSHIPQKDRWRSHIVKDLVLNTPPHVTHSRKD